MVSPWAPKTRVPERSWLAEHLLELSAEARRRLKWMGVAVEGTVDDFRRSWRRPKWHLLQD